MNPKVSIIVPIYNCEHLLSKSLTCLLNQSYTNLEIIVIDDYSTDNSFQIAKGFESSSVKIIRQENAGAAVARNKGLEYATGEYIQFFDIDDYLSIDKIEKQVKALEYSSDKVAVCNYISFFNDNDLSSVILSDQSSFIYSSDDPVEFLINLYGGYGSPQFIQTNSWLVPRSLVDKVGGWRNYRCPDDDGEFFARLLLASRGIVYVPDIYNYYRRSTNQSSLSQMKGEKYLHNVLLTIDLKHSYIKRCSSSLAVTKAFATQYLHFAIALYPKHKKLYKIALERYKQLNFNVNSPKLGGAFIELINKYFGWKAARLIKYYLREQQH